jgi:hypothetical protein
VTLISPKLVVAPLLFLLGGTPIMAAPARTTSTPPLVVIVMENHEYGTVVGSSSARYLNRTFIPSGTLFTNYHATDHPSLPNYLDMTSGTTSGCSSDSCPRRSYRTNNIFRQLKDAGIRWSAWQESMPSHCALDSSGTYAVKHNPAAYYRDLFPHLCHRNDVPYPSTLPSTLRPFTFVTPNICHDMHDCSVSAGDHWLRDHVPALLHEGAEVVVVFDEGSSSEGGGGHVMAAASGPGVGAGVRDRHAYDHFGLLGGMERWFGLRRLHDAATHRALPLGP